MQLASEFDINREAALEYLKRAGIARRPNVRKLTDQLVQEAGHLYETGLSLKNVAVRFDVNETTIRNELTAPESKCDRDAGGTGTSANSAAASSLQFEPVQER